MYFRLFTSTQKPMKVQCTAFTMLAGTTGMYRMLPCENQFEGQMNVATFHAANFLRPCTSNPRLLPNLTSYSYPTSWSFFKISSCQVSVLFSVAMLQCVWLGHMIRQTHGNVSKKKINCRHGLTFDKSIPVKKKTLKVLSKCYQWFPNFLCQRRE